MSEEKINSVIVEDENNSLQALQLLLEKYCPQVKVTGFAQTVEEAISTINRCKPDLVFLDIAMPDGDGFEVLEKVDYKLFEVIFTTAYDQYALKAFDFAALHYLLKPINFMELQDAVGRYRKPVSQTDFDSKIEVLRRSLNNQRDKIVLPSLEGLHLIEIDSIIRCESDNNYTTFYFKNGQKMVVSKTLQVFEKLLEDNHFARVHSKHLINLKYVKKYVRGRGGYVVFEDGSHVDVSAGRVQDFMAKLREYARTV